MDRYATYLEDLKRLEETLKNGVKNTPEFLDRINKPEKYPFLKNEDGSISTHQMAAEVDEQGNWFVFPTIVRLPNGKLHKFENTQEAMNYNLRMGNFLPMKSKKEALKYAEGGYKKGTPLEKFNPLQKQEVEDILSNPFTKGTIKQ